MTGIALTGTKVMAQPLIDERRKIMQERKVTMKRDWRECND